MFRREVARNLDLLEKFLVAQPAYKSLLGKKVPVVGGLDAPVDIARGQSNPIGSGDHVRRGRAVPVTDGLTVVHGRELLIGLGNSGVVEVTLELSSVQVQGADGAVLAIVRDEGIAASAKGVVDLDVVKLQLGVPLILRVEVGSREAKPWLTWTTLVLRLAMIVTAWTVFVLYLVTD